MGEGGAPARGEPAGRLTDGTLRLLPARPERGPGFARVNELDLRRGMLIMILSIETKAGLTGRRMG
jgi:hypothetical protein